jgi:hypothetical protein
MFRCCTRLEDDSVSYSKRFDVLLIIQTTSLQTELREVIQHHNECNLYTVACCCSTCYGNCMRIVLHHRNMSQELRTLYDFVCCMYIFWFSKTRKLDTEKKISKRLLYICTNKCTK